MKGTIQFLLRYKVTLFLFIFYVYLSIKVSNAVSCDRILYSMVSYAFANSIFIILLLNIIASLQLRKNIRFKILSFLLFIITSLFLTLDLFFIFNFQTFPSLGTFASILETNSVEAKSMISQYWIIAIILIIGIFTLNLISVSELKKSEIKIKISICIIVVLIISMPTVYLYKTTNNLDKENREYQRFNVDLKLQPLLTYSSLIYPTFPFILGDICIISSYVNQISDISKFDSYDKTIPENIIPPNNDNKNSIEKIFVILGESSYRKHYSLYGYDIKTTPFLDSLAKKNNSPLSYHTAISPASITRDAIRLTLTFSAPHNLNGYYQNKSVIDLAKEQGYETVWLSNQPKLGLNENYISQIASSNDKLKYLTNDNKMSTDDFDLIETLSLFYKKDKKQLIFLHLRGSHISYVDGYDKQDILDNKNEEAINYDKTIHHTDRFIKKLDTFIRNHNDPAILYYFSDHGELIYIGHGFDKGMQQYEVPLLIIKYNSEINTDSIINTYKNKETNLINTYSTSYILSEFMGYKVDSDSKQAIIDEGNYIFDCNSNVRLFKDIQPWKGSIQ